MTVKNTLLKRIVSIFMVFCMITLIISIANATYPTLTQADIKGDITVTPYTGPTPRAVNTLTVNKSYWAPLHKSSGNYYYITNGSRIFEYANTTPNSFSSNIYVPQNDINGFKPLMNACVYEAQVFVSGSDITRVDAKYGSSTGPTIASQNMVAYPNGGTINFTGMVVDNPASTSSNVAPSIFFIVYDRQGNTFMVRSHVLPQ